MAQPGPPPYTDPTGGYEKPPPYFAAAAQPVGGAYPQQPSQAGWTQQTTVTMPMPTHNFGYGSTVVVEPMAVPATQVIIVGGCPSCRVGVLQDSFSICGICCAIIFFPLGILCCLLMREKRCTNCGASF